MYCLNCKISVDRKRKHSACDLHHNWTSTKILLKSFLQSNCGARQMESASHCMSHGRLECGRTLQNLCDCAYELCPSITSVVIEGHSSYDQSHKFCNVLGKMSDTTMCLKCTRKDVNVDLNSAVRFGPL